MILRHRINAAYASAVICVAIAACSSDHDIPAYPVSPANAALTTSQTQKFTVNLPGAGTVNWSVDSIPGGNATIGTISKSGVYVPPATPGTHQITAATANDTNKSTAATVAVSDIAGVYMYHNDLYRSGQNLHEYALTPATVKSSGFGLRWSCSVDGDVYAQLLYVANLSIAGGTHNVLYVATQHDSIYAIDADDPACHVYWHTSFIGAGVTTVPAGDTACSAISTEIGITGTPVIDPVNKIIYSVAATKENVGYVNRLHALNLTTGAEQTGSPVTIQASVYNTEGVADGFSAMSHLQRSALMLYNGGVFAAWASFCDHPPYWGWLMRYDATSLAQTAVFNVAPNGTAGAIWMSGNGPAVDSTGNIFLGTGNGSFNNNLNVIPAVAPFNNFGESMLKLDPTTLAVKDFYTPSNEIEWSGSDNDLGSAGVILLPDGIGPAAHPNLMIGADKEAHLFVIDRNSMQGFHPSTDPIVQLLTLPNCGVPESCVLATPAYWNGTIYIAQAGGPLMAFTLAGGLVNADSSGTATPSFQSGEGFTGRGPTPVISASPAGNALVWALDNSASGSSSTSRGPAVLRAYDATSLGTALYLSSTVPADAGGLAVKFTAPLVANGRVYTGGGGQVTVYGLPN
jgi:hypothetical protein